MYTFKEKCRSVDEGVYEFSIPTVMMLNANETSETLRSSIAEIVKELYRHRPGLTASIFPLYPGIVVEENEKPITLR